VATLFIKLEKEKERHQTKQHHQRKGMEVVKRESRELQHYRGVYEKIKGGKKGGENEEEGGRGMTKEEADGHKRVENCRRQLLAAQKRVSDGDGSSSSSSSSSSSAVTMSMVKSKHMSPEGKLGLFFLLLLLT